MALHTNDLSLSMHKFQTDLLTPQRGEICPQMAQIFADAEEGFGNAS